MIWHFPKGIIPLENIFNKLYQMQILFFYEKMKILLSADDNLLGNLLYLDKVVFMLLYIIQAGKYDYLTNEVTTAIS